MWTDRIWWNVQVWLTLNASISLWVVAANSRVLRPHLDSLRRVQRSVSDVCMGEDKSNVCDFCRRQSPAAQRVLRSGRWGSIGMVCLISASPWEERSHWNTTLGCQRSRSLCGRKTQSPSFGDQIPIRCQS